MKKIPGQKGGYVIIFQVLLFLAICLVILIGVVAPVLSNLSAARSFMYSKRSFMLADSGVQEAIYRLSNSKQLGSSASITLSQGTASITTANTSTGKSITVNGLATGYQRNVQTNLSLGTGIAFHYGIQSGEGGFQLNNSSSVTGNVFSDGPVTGGGNTIRGDVISAGSSGLVSGITATGTIYAHTIQSSTIQKDAYYTSIDSFTTSHTSGTLHPGSPDQPSAPLPISDAQIADWETQAAAGTVATCSSGTYNITSSVTIGPMKIPCDLSIKGNGIIVTIAGPVWVVGNITTQTSPVIKMSSSLGIQNVAIIADDPSAPTTSGIISLGQNTSFQGSGSTGSFVFMISQNTSAENGGSTNAISVGQSSSALVGYAIHGLISLSQSVSLKEVTAYKIALSQSSNVTYDTGLPNTLFSSGPGGGYNLVDWTEI